VFHSFVALERAWAFSKHLDEEFRKTSENAQLKLEVIQGLIRQRYSLREAVSLYHKLCRSGDMLSIRTRAQLMNAPEEEVLAHHLVCLVTHELPAGSTVQSEVLPRLERECAQIRASQAL
jgi:hypothetical protein